MNNKIKNLFFYLLSAVLLVAISVGVVFSNDAYAKDEEDSFTPVKPTQVRIDSDNWASDKDKEAQKNGDEPAESGKNASLEDDSVWNIYAQLLMTTKSNDDKDKEKSKNPIHRAYDGATAGIVGDGGITLNFPYNKMNSDANKIRKQVSKDEKDNAGSQMASFLSTYSSYGYIDTNSGQKQLSDAGNKVSGGFKNFFGIIVAFSLVINYVMNKILDWLVFALIDLNPLTLLGLGDVEISDNNPVAKAIKGLFDSLRLGDVFEKVQQIGFMVIAIMFIFGVIWAITRGDVRKAKTRSRKWLVRLFVSALGVPLLLFISKDLGHQIKDMKEMNSNNDNIVSQYILNTRGWAASSNLSPSGLEGYEFPNATAKTNYIDKDFDPVRSRKLIKGINKHTYDTLYSGENKYSGFDLLNKWMANDSFGVNTYIGDINRADLNKNGVLPAFEGYKETFGKKGNEPKLSDIEYSMWSATQNYDKELRDVNSKNFKKASNVGVRDNNSFSTQTVILLLQSALDNNQAEFYANNLGPTGAQGALKNVTTVKTNWQEVTMPGDGTFGVIGSYVGLGAHAVSYSIITIAAIMGLLTISLLEAIVRVAKNVWATLWHGDGYAFLSLAGIVGAGFISLTIAFKIAKWFSEIIDWAAKVTSEVTGGGIPSGFIEILANLIMIVLAIVLGFGRKIGKTNYPPIKFIMSIPYQIAFDYDDKIKMLSGKDNTDFKGAFSEFGHTFKNGGRANLQALGNHGKAYGRATVGAAQGAGIGVGQSIRRKGSLKNFGIPDARKAAGDAIVGTKYGFNNAFEQPTKQASASTKEQLEKRSSDKGELDNSEVSDSQGRQTSLNNVSIGDDGRNVENNKNVDRNNLNGYKEDNDSNEKVSNQEQLKDVDTTTRNHLGYSRNSERQDKESVKEGTTSMVKDAAKDAATGAAVGVAAESVGVSKDTVDAASGASDLVSGAKQVNSMSRTNKDKTPNNNMIDGYKNKNVVEEKEGTVINSTSNQRSKRNTDTSQITSTQTSKGKNVVNPNSRNGVSKSNSKGNTNNHTITKTRGTNRPLRSNNINSAEQANIQKTNTSKVGNSAPKRRRRATEQTNTSKSSQVPIRKKQETKVSKTSSSNSSSNRPVKSESKQSTQKHTVQKEYVRPKENKQSQTTKRTSTRESRTSNLKEQTNTENTYNRVIRRRNKK